MKIGVLKETKVPIDNRVAFSPKQLHMLKSKFPDAEFIVQSSNIRAYPDDKYKELDIEVRDDISDCDILFGIKETDINTLIPNKHYLFFGHIAKMQPYNRLLIQKMMELGITFTDYEYLVDENNHRLTAFGWWAGVVGAYNTLRAYGLKHSLFKLPAPDLKFTLDKLIEQTSAQTEYACKIIITGKGRTSEGVQYVLNKSGYKKISNEEFLEDNNTNERVYKVVSLETLVERTDTSKSAFDREHFRNNPSLYKGDFIKYARKADVYIPCHFWGQHDPVYLNKEDLKDDKIRIKVIGDVTCDIEGSVMSTIRPSTHDKPFYDYNPIAGEEEDAFSSPHNISVMAVDTLPNALSLDTSKYFGENLIEHIIDDLIAGEGYSDVIDRATILKNGHLTNKFSYLEKYAAEK